MNDSKLPEVFFFVGSLWWIYRGSTLLIQSLHQKQHIIWYKRFKLTRGLACLIFGLVAVTDFGIVFAGIPMPLGTTGEDLLLGLIGVALLLGILSWWNKAHDPSETKKKGLLAAISNWINR